MYVCLCNAVSDKQIAKAAREGACCMRELRERLGVGARCGKCVPTARAVLHAHAPASAEADTGCASQTDIGCAHKPGAGLSRVVVIDRVPALAA